MYKLILLIAVMAASTVFNTAIADEWQCKGFGYAYSFKTKSFYFSPMQRYIVDTNSIPRKTAFYNDWNAYFKGEIRKANQYTVKVVQDCENTGFPTGVGKTLSKLKAKYNQKNFNGYRLQHYYYQR
ncbi:MAG: hypothetical protein JKX76_06455 [Colwellia sp.]|nr:hypothetical protein [Colwellia sp.]